MTSLSEQFILHYLNDKHSGADDICQREEAEILCERLKLGEEDSTGFILTKKQFAYLNNTFKIYIARSNEYEEYFIKLFPKSGHILQDELSQP